MSAILLHYMRELLFIYLFIYLLFFIYICISFVFKTGGHKCYNETLQECYSEFSVILSYFVLHFRFFVWFFFKSAYACARNFVSTNRDIAFRQGNNSRSCEPSFCWVRSQKIEITQKLRILKLFFVLITNHKSSPVKEKKNMKTNPCISSQFQQKKVWLIWSHFGQKYG